MNPLSRRKLHTKTQQPANVPLPPALRRTTGQEANQADPSRRDELLTKIEALLLLANEPLSLRRLASLAELPDAAVARKAIDRLREMYDADGSAFQIEDIAGGFQLLTRPAFYPWLARIRPVAEESKLTPALMEALVIVAQRQPITRADLEAIRGVRCDDALNSLLERKLIQITGRHDSLGRPALYGTTKKFMQVFGLKDLSELATS